jgi:hypothetical protein
MTGSSQAVAKAASFAEFGESPMGGGPECGAFGEWALRLVEAQDVPAVFGRAFRPHETLRQQLA